MTNTFFISDTHFGHNNILTFKKNGKLIRPGFEDGKHMDEYMIEKWNETVRPNDVVYHIGDFAMKKKFVRTAEKLNGKKKLIRGNHDIEKAKYYLKYFDDILGVKVFPKHNIVCSHFPIHPDSLWAWKKQTTKINLHGHTHVNDVMIEGMKDLRYINLCVEKIDYTPVPFNDILEVAEKRRKVHDYFTGQ